MGRGRVKIFTQEPSSKAVFHTGQSAAKLLHLEGRFGECRRFRDYNQSGASLRYSPLPLVTELTKGNRRVAPLG